MRNKGMKNITSVLLAAAMAVSGLFSAGNVVNLHAEEVNPYGLHTPIERDTDGDGTKEMTWDCIIFGVYPQNEITADTKLGKSKLNALKKLSESQWIPLDNPAKSDETISYYVGGTGKKYLRMTKKDATYSLDNSDNFYHWDGEETYHYYEYEPMKWRVLSIDTKKNTAVIVADKGMDTQCFHPTKNITYVNGQPKDSNRWKYSTIRSFLNGYDSSVNTYKYDFSTGYNFKDMAFSDTDKEAIVTTTVKNNESYHHYFDGTDTQDDVYLLSYQQMSSLGSYSGYGFTKDRYRLTQATTFAKAMGAYSAHGYSYSWLRSSGDGTYRANVSCYSGDVHAGGNNVNYLDYTVRPALTIDLSKVDSYQPAGEVDNEGRYAYYKATFDLDGVKTEKYGDVVDIITIPENYEENGYEYTYTVNGEDITRALKEGSYVLTGNTTIKVTKSDVFTRNVVTVYYSTGWTNPYIHFKTSNTSWTEAPGVKMVPSDLAGYSFKYTIELWDATGATVCFNNGSGSWDSKNGANYTFNRAGTYAVKNGGIITLATPTATVTSTATVAPTVAPTATVVPTVTTAPTVTPTAAPTVAPTVTPAPTVEPTQVPVEKTVTVYYYSGWEQAYIHYTTDQAAWTAVPGVAMEKNTDGNGYEWKYVIPVGDGEKATVCFNNGNGSWDSKNGANYTMTKAGVYAVKNGQIINLQ